MPDFCLGYSRPLFYVGIFPSWRDAGYAFHYELLTEADQKNHPHPALESSCFHWLGLRFSRDRQVVGRWLLRLNWQIHQQFPPLSIRVPAMGLSAKSDAL